MSLVDALLVEAQRALGVLSGLTRAVRRNPGLDVAERSELSETEKREAAALMRVNHVGEVCAQALYRGQLRATHSAPHQRLFREAADEEREHLAWTAERVQELGGRLSVLNPLWYAGAFTLGFAAGRVGDRWSLGFMAETERQVEQHLATHLERLPVKDERSRRIVAQMKEDEARHGESALDAGGRRFPLPARLAMRAMGKVMTSTAYYL